MTTAAYGTVNNIIINDIKKNANTQVLSFLCKFTLSSSHGEFGYNEHPAIGRKFFSSEKIPVTGQERLIGSHSSARFSFKLS